VCFVAICAPIYGVDWFGFGSFPFCERPDSDRVHVDLDAAL